MAQTVNHSPHLQNFLGKCRKIFLKKFLVKKATAENMAWCWLGGAENAGRENDGHEVDGPICRA